MEWEGCGCASPTTLDFSHLDKLCSAECMVLMAISRRRSESCLPVTTHRMRPRWVAEWTSQSQSMSGYAQFKPTTSIPNSGTFRATGKTSSASGQECFSADPTSTGNIEPSSSGDQATKGVVIMLLVRRNVFGKSSALAVEEQIPCHRLPEISSLSAKKNQRRQVRLRGGCRTRVRTPNHIAADTSTTAVGRVK